MKINCHSLLRIASIIFTSRLDNVSFCHFAAVLYIFYIQDKYVFCSDKDRLCLHSGEQQWRPSVLLQQGFKFYFRVESLDNFQFFLHIHSPILQEILSQNFFGSTTNPLSWSQNGAECISGISFRPNIGQILIFGSNNSATEQPLL